MESIEWAHARSAVPRAYGPYDDLGDNQCAANDSDDPNVMALGAEGIAIYGSKEEILEFLSAAALVVEAFEMPADPMRSKLEELAREAIGDLETVLQRDEATVYFSDNNAVIIVPGEEGLYSGRVITIYPDGNRLTADTGSWGTY